MTDIEREEYLKRVTEATKSFTIEDLAAITGLMVETLYGRLRSEHGFGCYAALSGMVENGDANLLITDMDVSTWRVDYTKTFRV